MNEQQSRRPNDERHPESRMRENRPYGSMRGDAARMKPTTAVGSIHSPASPTLLVPKQACLNFNLHSMGHLSVFGSQILVTRSLQRS